MLCNNGSFNTTTWSPASQLFASAINMLAASQCLLSDTFIVEDVTDMEYFDFIVVGGGSAGSVVANRLSEIAHWKVLLLEAGPEPPIESDIPYMDGTLYNSKYDWQYVTKSDGVRHQALKNGAVQWPRGKMLGGCSSINAMFYVRGRDNDFQSWVNEGNPSWTPGNVNFYFKKAENLQDMTLNKDPFIYATYGHNGPQIINTYNSTYRDINLNIVDSWRHIGMKKVSDINAARYTGYGLTGILRVTANNGQRQSTYRSYLNKINKRLNLNIVTNAFVKKILINNKKATAVEVDVNGIQKRFFGKREVIISAGSVNTPQLLMLSGIGPKEHLKSKNIENKVNLPYVGKNLQDHLYIPIIICGDKPGYEDTPVRMFDALKYLYNKTGYLAHGSESDAGAFFSRYRNMAYPEFQSHTLVLWKNSSLTRQFFKVYRDEIVDSITQFNSEKALYVLTFHILHPFSRGSIYLNTSNPYDYPIIDANYLGDSRDLQASVDGINILLKVLDAPYFKSINAYVPKINIPQCNQYKHLSNLYWRCYSLQMTTTLFHPVGTAKMGQSSQGSVVNNFLKVHDVENLRVIDASVMPTLTSGNTNAPTIMIGEMGSDMVKAEHLTYYIYQNECFNTSSSSPASQLFASAINLLAASQCLMSDTFKADDATDLEYFDFIIVGGGSAGCVVANRLSEIAHWKVLLLEAGPEPPIEADIPHLDSTLYNSKYDWKYKTKSDGVKHQALKNGALAWTRGKMLGGSSSINAMYYVRGRDYDFQSWLNEGNPSWSPENVNFYFRKAENLQDMTLNNDPFIYETYGHKGPQIINTFNSTYREITLKIIDSWNYIGMKKVSDINAARYTGYGLTGILRVTANNGQRQSTYRSYLNKINKRKNLKIVTNAFVKKGLINNKKATGVEVDVNGIEKRFFAKLEVIVCAGSVNTPQLLMLSGIGPKEHLESKSIENKVNLPSVGKNLQDHIYIPIYICGDEPGYEDTSNKMFDVVKYLYNKTGYLAHGFVLDSAAFYSRYENMPYPEFQSHAATFWRNSSVIRQFLHVFRDDIIDSITQCNSEKAVYVFSFHLLHPFSRGSIYLNTSNPYDHPIIDANYFADARDVQASIDGINILLNVLNAPYFKSINAYVPRINIPQCNQYEFPSDLYWACYSIQMTNTLFHPVGTAKMGQNPIESVVNDFLKVHGVNNLRVIDTSVMPSLTSGNTNAPVIMIGEMGSDMIKADHLIH